MLERGRKYAAPELRALVALAVRRAPAKYTAATLGRPSAEYQAWITKPESWGGYIECDILADHYRAEIVSVDIQSGLETRYGEGRGYTRRCFLLFDGIHYDATEAAAGVTGEGGGAAFPVGDDRPLAGLRALARGLREQRRFTDVSGFDLRCMVCGAGLSGQRGAQQHARETGHINFREWASAR